MRVVATRASRPHSPVKHICTAHLILAFNRRKTMALPPPIVITEAQLHEALESWLCAHADPTWVGDGFEITKVQRYKDTKGLGIVLWCIDVKEKTA
jgi:hypothetical protein